MALAPFTYNGEQYAADSSTNPPTLWRMSAQGPVQMSTGGLPPALRQQANQALQGAGAQNTYTPPLSPQAYPPPATPNAPPVSGMTMPPTGPGQAEGITVGPDPNDPNKLIWVDRKTGQPAPQPGGTGTPYTTQSGADAQAATAQAGAQAAATKGQASTAAQQRILAQYGRTGWTVTGEHDDTDAVRTMDSEGNYITKNMPNGNTVWTIAGPGGKSDEIVVKASTTTPGEYTPIKGPSNATLPPQLSAKDAQYVKGEGYFLPIDPSPDKLGDPSNWRKILPDGVPNADDEIKKAVERQTAEGDRNARQRNEAQYGIYADDATTQRILNEARNSGLRGDELKQKIDEFNRTLGENQRQFDIKQADTDKKTQDALLTGAANRGLTTAQTGQTQATTGQTIAATQRTQALLPGELEKQLVDIGYTKAQIDEVRQRMQIAAAPTLQGGTTQPVLTRMDPRTGAIDQSQINLAYQPKTQAEIAARVGQIQSLMNAKSAEVQAKVGKNNYTADNALQEFNQWYGQNVAGQIDALQAAQDDTAFARGKDLAAMRAVAQTGANATAAQAVTAASGASAARALGANQNPTYGGGFNATPTPDYEKVARDATAEALKYLDPTAGAAPGTLPNYQKLDIRGLLGSPYGAPGVQNVGAAPGSLAAGAQAGAPAAAAAAPIQPAPGAQPAPAAPGTPGSPDWWDALMNRTRADQGEQRIQAQAMPGSNPPPPPQASGIWAAMPDWLKNGTPPDQPQAAGAALTGAYDAGPGAWGQWANYVPSRDGVPQMVPIPNAPAKPAGMSNDDWFSQLMRNYGTYL